MIKKQERKERLLKIYRMLMHDSMDKVALKEVRSELAGFLGDDTGLFLLEKGQCIRSGGEL